ncbi:hypothetical protein NUT36_08340 [Staphylococcus epidermidis]|uniref:type II restriction enzyme n=1 Tax=Staphylococcus epidermidis TaxID=1282 RepID=UPI00138DDA9C|nr:hypothetical protein [Staphylococcus epidermidis]MCG1340621.1 hypothetical protein [Staphylococcus epidermidis]MCG1656008.1 hypothetical protein [Staphylococcus epidermidis]MCG1674198.1 hypothetical protein [Staphylococcus epidermidis]MCG1804823.1 hypothetical protein [Staphylococcus epidermidis]MCG2385576.1 hypothetical protein [Staphylococcus epidermidis]
MKSKKKNLTLESWTKLFEKYKITQEVNENNYFVISTEAIKEYREPRLMTKFDTSHLRPTIFKKNKLGILPIERTKYIISDFKLYEELPDIIEKNNFDIIKVNTEILESFETIDKENINSEANAINILSILKILPDFLETESNIYSTFNGRMTSPKFKFKIDKYKGDSLDINVNKVQIEIDAGFESLDSVIIVEAKRILSKDFIIRQLYYPFRHWQEKVRKPIRLIFMVYTNGLYRLFEYEFADIFNYSSIKLLHYKIYSIEDTNITQDDIYDAYINTKEEFTDSIENKIPFIQADSMERIISIMEYIYDNKKTNENEISEIMSFTPRQANYYFNAGRYLELFKKKNNKNKMEIYLTPLARQIYKMKYKDKQLAIISQIFKHKIFRICYEKILENGRMISKYEIAKLLTKNNIVEKSSVRRAQTVVAWFKWIFKLTEI